MEQTKNPVKNVFYAVRAWFARRAVRKMFGIAILAAGFFAVISSFERSGISATAAVICLCAVFIFSAADTVITRQQYKGYIEEIRRKHFIRMAEGKPETGFSTADELLIKKKLKSYTGTIMLKVTFALFFVIIIVRMYL